MIDIFVSIHGRSEQKAEAAESGAIQVANSFFLGILSNSCSTPFVSDEGSSRVFIIGLKICHNRFDASGILPARSESIPLLTGQSRRHRRRPIPAINSCGL
jgi:hypothetical protein